MLPRAYLAIGATCAMSASASAAISFTFEDPGPPRELMHTASGGPADGQITYSSANPVNLVVDGTAEGFGVVTFASTLTMNISVGMESVVSGVPGARSAPISGTFTFSTFGTAQALLTGTFMNASLIAFPQAGALISTSGDSGLIYTASGPLLTLIQGSGFSGLAAPFDASFTLTDITPNVTFDQFNHFTSFTANAAFTGTANLIPSPSTIAMVSGMGLLGLRRRRRS